MNLFDLFEQELSALQPGETREETDVRIRDITKIEQRLREIERYLYSSESLANTFAKDKILQQSLLQLTTRLARKKDYLTRMMERPTASTDRILSAIQTECSDFLEVARSEHELLYRGIRSDASAFQGRSRDERKPKDSNKEVSTLFDELLQQLGFQALRKNSIFTSSNRGFASTYGWNVYMIFPKNGFSFTSTNTKDLILDSMSMLADNRRIQRFVGELKNFLIDNVPNWQSTVLGKAIYYDSWSEMFKELNDQFHGQNQYKLPEQFNANWMDFISAQTLNDNFDPYQDNLARALNTGHEVLINGEYWALKHKDWRGIVNKRLIDTPSISRFDQNIF